MSERGGKIEEENEGEEDGEKDREIGNGIGKENMRIRVGSEEKEGKDKISEKRREEIGNDIKDIIGERKIERKNGNRDIGEGNEIGKDEIEEGLKWSEEIKEGRLKRVMRNGEKKGKNEDWKEGGGRKELGGKDRKKRKIEIDKKGDRNVGKKKRMKRIIKKEDIVVENEIEMEEKKKRRENNWKNNESEKGEIEKCGIVEKKRK